MKLSTLTRVKLSTLTWPNTGEIVHPKSPTPYNLCNQGSVALKSPIVWQSAPVEKSAKYNVLKMVFRAIKSDRARTKGVRYRSQPVLEKAKARALFKAVARQRQQETHSQSHRPSHPKSKIKSVKSGLRQGGNEQSLLKFSTSQKQTHPAAHRQTETDRQAKKLKQERQAIKKTRIRPTQSRYKLKTQPNSKGCSEMRY